MTGVQTCALPIYLSCQSSDITNTQGRMFFENIINIVQNNPSIQTQLKKKLKKILKGIFESLKRLPESSNEIPLIVNGGKNGADFIDHFLPKLVIPQYLTKISFRHSGLKPSHCKEIAKLLMSSNNIKELDLSQNELKGGANIIIKAATGHPSLTHLLMESCGIDDSSVNAIIDLLSYSRTLGTFRAPSLKFSNANVEKMKDVVKNNIYLKNVDLGQQLQATCLDSTSRNGFINEYSDTIARSPFQRTFRAKLDVFKSIKGRQMIDGKQNQKEKARGTAFFDDLVENEKKAKNIDLNESAQTTEHIRYGSAETVGRRPQMEDVSIIVPGVPTESSMLFGLFDGHGGRDASEYASQNLPNNIKTRVENGSDLQTAISDSFKMIQSEMKPWCVYFGTTAVLAFVDGSTLTVANVGDTRCVLAHDGQAVRLTVDHKPDLPEEAEYIQSKGGIVKEGRLRGMLAVSRALGDGFLGDCVNPNPYIRQVQLSPQDTYIILACDGVWDVMSDQDAVDLIATEIDPLEAARKIRDHAFELNSEDNISVIVAFLSVPEE